MRQVWGADKDLIYFDFIFSNLKIGLRKVNYYKKYNFNLDISKKMLNAKIKNIL